MHKYYKMAKEGDFSFIKNTISRTLLTDMYDTITKRNLWSFIKSETDINSFTNCNVRQKEEILYNLNYSLFNVRNFNWSLGNMKQIADNGWEYFVSSWKND
jgi:hypothetical protein